jgi:uncharacterized damage-inducible protein DinB
VNEALVPFLHHNAWATLQLLGVCEPLTQDQLDRTVEGTYGTIGATLVHIVSAEAGYLKRMTGEDFGQGLEEENFPGVPLLRERYEAATAGLERAAHRFEPDHIARWTRDGFDRSMPAGMLFVQTINHSTEHRSQVMTILTQLGIEPPELDGWAFAEATGAFQETPAS